MSFAEQLAEQFLARQSILERYIDLCPIPCFIVDKSGETIFINEAYQQAYDVRLDQVNKRQWESLIVEEDREEYLEGFNQLITGKLSHFYSNAKTLIHGEPVNSMIRITHVPGNGYIGYVIFLCAQATGCPVRNIVENYLSKPAQVVTA